VLYLVRFIYYRRCDLFNSLYNKLNMKKVTGLGGVFFKSDHPESMNEWYAKNLGLTTSKYGTTFEWRHADDPSKEGSTSWCTFPADSKYFDPSTKPFMINYRVDDLVALVAELKKDNVTIIDEIAEYDYGKFIHILDPEGNVIELWEPK
jgi:predicted enzyme related to lactoylglutathione lyase